MIKFLSINIKKILSFLCVFLFLYLFLYITIQKLGINFDFSVLWIYKERFFSGFKMTLIISFFSLILSLFIGMISTRAINSSFLPISYFFKGYIQIIRGTPLLVQIFFFYYIVGTAWGINNRYIAGVMILSIFEGAYITEIIRGGLNSIGTQQYEISKAIGLSKFQTFSLIIFPQLMQKILPALIGQFTAIIKDSSLLSVVAVIELTQITQEISSINYALFENYLFLGLLYFIITVPFTILSYYLERKYHYES